MTTSRRTRIPAFRLVPEPIDAEAHRLHRFHPAPARHQLGGEADFLDDDQIPRCPECHDAMALYAKLDSVNEAIRLPDLGVLVVFACLECCETASFIHCE